MLLLIDNYDSFTYNLVQYFQCLQQTVLVHKHDQISLNDVHAMAPHHIVLSPGPNNPEAAGISLPIIQTFHQSIPILGVCLGHQCLAHAFGGNIIQSPNIMHGKTSRILHHKQGLFQGIPNFFKATRYHSLAVEISSLPTCFSIDAWADETIMAISHRHLPLFGLQFHPEAILSEHGLKILHNFLHYEPNSHL